MKYSVRFPKEFPEITIMDNPEQYLLQVLHRTQAGLQDSLIPFHGSKMRRLTERLEQAASLKQELQSLQHVSGFTRAALSMEWVMERVTKSGEDFSPDQFDIDATLLSDRLFEAFLSEPFDAPAEPPGCIRIFGGRIERVFRRIDCSTDRGGTSGIVRRFCGGCA